MRGTYLLKEVYPRRRFCINFSCHPPIAENATVTIFHAVFMFVPPHEKTPIGVNNAHALYGFVILFQRGQHAVIVGCPASKAP